MPKCLQHFFFYSTFANFMPFAICRWLRLFRHVCVICDTTFFSRYKRTAVFLRSLFRTQQKTTTFLCHF